MRRPQKWSTDHKGLGDKLLCILVTEALLLEDKTVDIAREVPKYVTNDVLAAYCARQLGFASTSLNQHSIGDRYESELGHMYKTSGRDLTGVRAEVGRLMLFYRKAFGNTTQKTYKGNDFDVGFRLLEFLVADILDQKECDKVGHEVQFYIKKERCLGPYYHARQSCNHDDGFDGRHPLNMNLLSQSLSEKMLDIHFKTKLARGWSRGSNSFGDLVPFVQDLIDWVDRNVDDKADIQHALNVSSRQPTLFRSSALNLNLEQVTPILEADTTSTLLRPSLLGYTTRRVVSKKRSEDVVSKKGNQDVICSNDVSIVSPELVKEASVPVTAGRGPLGEHACPPRTIKWFSRVGHQHAFDVFPCCGQVVREDDTGKYSLYKCSKKHSDDNDFQLHRGSKNQAKSRQHGKFRSRPIASWKSYKVTVLPQFTTTNKQCEISTNANWCDVKKAVRRK